MAPLMQKDVLDLAKCPHCGVASPLLQRIHQFYFKRSLASQTNDWSVYMCRSCGQPVMAGGKHGTGGPVEAVIPHAREIDSQIPERPRSYLQRRRGGPAASFD
jgi:predicted nucleic-acid-binding Zn-ribbon protein